MFEQREIVLIPVPFTDLSAVKRRPVLILSNTAYNTTSPDVIVAAITSKLNHAENGRIINSTDLESGTLPRTSLVRADKIYTLGQGIILKRYGRIRVETFADVLRVLDEILGRSQS